MKAAQLAKSYSKPLVLDPVGVGASQLRTDAAQSLIPYVNIIRGNASEILVLANEEGETKGVEASRSVSQASMAARKLAESLQKIVVVSGPVDLITDGSDEINLPYGSSLMPLVTGMGCALTAVMASFTALDLSPYKASLLSTAYFGLCGQQSEKKAKEPGSFRQLFIDSLFKPDWNLFNEFIATSREGLTHGHAK